MNFKDLNLSNNSDYKIVSVLPGVNIKVLKHLPIEDKNALVNITLQKSEEFGIYNLTKLDMYFHLNIVYLYTDIIFDDEDRLDETNLYDKLSMSGVLEAILSQMDEEEYNELYSLIMDTMNMRLTYNNTPMAVIQNFIRELPQQIDKMKDIIANFNPEDFQEIMNFVKAANNGKSV